MQPAGRRGRRLALAAVLAALVTAVVHGGDFGPWSTDPRHPVVGDPGAPAREPAPAPSPSPFSFAFGVWSELLTRLDGPRCEHRPSCSAFAHRAVARHGLPLGAWMALNRLLRGAHSSALRTLPRVAVPAGVFFRDSLEDNQFWREGYLPLKKEE